MFQQTVRSPQFLAALVILTLAGPWMEEQTMFYEAAH